MPRLLASVALACALVAGSAAATPAQQPAHVTLFVPRFLLLGPAPLPRPLFHEETRGGYGPRDLVTTPLLAWSASRIAAGTSVPWLDGTALVWQEREAGSDGQVELGLAGQAAGTPTVALLVATVQVERLVKAQVEVTGNGLRHLLVDGVPVATSSAAGSQGSGEAKGTVELVPGPHLVAVQTVQEGQEQGPWGVGVRLGVPVSEGIAFSLPPQRELDLLDILDRPDITSVAVSADGTLAALTLRRVVAGSDDSESWVEVRQVADGSRRWSFRGGWEASDVAFAPTGRVLAWLAKDKTAAKGVESATLWTANLDTGEVKPVVERLEGLKRFLFDPTSTAVVVATVAKAAADPRGVKLLEGLLDRQKGYRDKEVLWLVRLAGGPRVRLTAGALTTRAAAFSPDGRRLLVRREVEDLSERPFSRHELWELDLATFAARKLRDFAWLDDVFYAPDGRRLVVVAGPSAFGEVGRNLPPGMIPNEGDGQVYLFDPTSGEVTCLTRDFAPAVVDAAWPRGGGELTVRAEVGDRVRLFRWQAASGAFQEIDAGSDVVSAWAAATGAPVLVAVGSGPWRPEAAWVVRGKALFPTLLADPAQDWYGDVRRGRIEEWDTTTAAGRRIPGRCYLPPDFDPSRSYPAIVYYYAGTSPVSREFGGRYPKEWWATRGYVVYVPQPSGCTGYGQEHSALHVNEWGRLVVDEIIEATRNFLAAHPYVDPKRVGCIGASYGGFTTMLLLTRTDLFAAAVAHAGISSISSYWGEGYWGYSYNALSAAGSFPWNNRELYVDRSALFAADRVKTPLLLTHGTADTNVPVGESDSFYTALKLVGAPVEYLQVEGEDHWILEHAKRVVWSRAIVAWFDRFLKGQPEWWAQVVAPKEKGKEGGSDK